MQVPYQHQNLHLRIATYLPDELFCELLHQPHAQRSSLAQGPQALVQYHELLSLGEK
jgi:hypothetical protein